jgi:hypothetical protein
MCPELAVVGKVDDPDELDLDPVVVPVCAYKIETREEVIEKFPFRPVMPPGTVAYLERIGGQTAGVNVAVAVLNDCVIADARERWDEFLGRDDLAIEATTLADLFKALVEHYGERPTKRSTGSSRTGTRSGRTSRAAQPSMV